MKISKVTFTIIAIWALGASYLVFQNKLSSQGAGDFNRASLERASGVSTFREFLEVYYNFGRDSSLSGKVGKLSQVFSKSFGGERLPYFERDMAYLAKERGFRKSKIHQIFFDINRNRYSAVIEVTRSLPNKSDEKYLMSVSAKLEGVDVDNSQVVKITGFEEKILTTEMNINDSKVVSLSPGIESVVRFPCRLKSVSSIVDDGKIEFKMLSGRKQVSFKVNEEIPENSQLEARCRESVFKIVFSPSKGRASLFLAVSNSEGTRIYQRVSEKKKLRDKLRKDLGLRIKD